MLAFAPCAPGEAGAKVYAGGAPLILTRQDGAVEGHQCQPSFSKPEASVFPVFPSGSGGNGGS